MSEVALNVTAQVTERLRVGAQLFARELGPTGNYEAKFDWFYLDYRIADWLGVRAGRSKIPFGLYNVFADNDSARAFVLMPQSVYPTVNRDFLLAQTGVELYGYIDLCDAGALDYRAYGGTIFLDQPPIVPGAPLLVLDVHAPFVVGARLFWETPIDGLRVGGTVQSLQIDWRYLVGGTTSIDVEFPITIWLASIEYVLGDLLLAAEYSRWDAQIVSDEPTLLPTIDVLNERWYALVAYRLTPWLQLGAYFASTYPDVDDRDGHDHYHHDVALTARFDVGDHFLVKLEGHFMRGTANLDPALNGGTPLIQLERDWALLLAKLTAWF
jgi:hypothetical protein